MVYAENKGENREHPTKRKVSLRYPYTIPILSLYYPYTIPIVSE